MISETNLQNIPRDHRIKNMFVSRQGYVFVEADLSQAEARIVAWKAEEISLIKRYASGEDIHSYVSSIIFGYPVKKGMVERQTGKTIIHASNYKVGPRKLVDIVLRENDLVITEKEARQRQNRYYQTFQNIKSVFQREIRLELRMNNRVIVNPFGRRRRFWNPWGDELFRQAYSHYAQSTVADVMNQALQNCWRLFTPNGIHIVAQVHDSILFEIPSELIGQEFKHILHQIVEAMSIPFVIKNRELIIPIQLAWGSSWGNLEEFVIKKEETNRAG